MIGPFGLFCTSVQLDPTVAVSPFSVITMLVVRCTLRGLGPEAILRA